MTTAEFYEHFDEVFPDLSLDLTFAAYTWAVDRGFIDKAYDIRTRYELSEDYRPGGPDFYILENGKAVLINDEECRDIINQHLPELKEYLQEFDDVGIEYYLDDYDINDYTEGA